MAAPIATGDQYTLEQGSILTVAGDTNVLKNDTDADGHPLKANLLYNAGHGALTFNEDGTFTYKPYDPNWTGEDTFYYTATDGSEVSEPIAVTITVTKVTGGDTGGTSTPVAVADTFDMNGAAAQGNVLENDTNAASASILYNPSYGALDFKADGSFVYTPYDTYTGEDAFFYTVKDANGVESQPVKVIIKGEKTTTGGGDTGGGNGPDANADTITLTHTSGQNYSGSTVLANDTNVEGVTPTLVYNPGWGTVAFNADGTFSYVLAPWATEANGFEGKDEFFYKVSETEVVKVSLTVPAATGGDTGGEQPVGEVAPVAQADTFETVTLDGARSFTSTASLLTNDTATNGDAMTAEKMWNPGWGSVTVNADGTFTYVLADWATAANGFEGKDEFFYVAKDNDGESQVVKVSLNNITVPAVEPPPAADIGIAVSHSGTDTVVGEGGTTDTISIVLKSQPTANVIVTVQEDTIAGVKADKAVTFTPTNWNTAQTVTLSATDNLTVDGPRSGQMYITASSADENYDGLIAADAFPVTVNDNDVEANEPPSAVWLNAEMTEDDVSVSVTPSASDWNGDAVTFRLVGQPEKGTVSYNEATKQFTFTPKPGAFDALNTGASENVTFQYVAHDGQVNSDPATVTIKVNGVTDAVTPPPAVLPVISATTAPGGVNEGDVATFGLERTGDISQALTVNIDTSLSGATAGTDFTAPSTVTFAANSATATFNVQTNKDTVADDLETIEFRIAEGTGYTVGAADGNVTEIIDVPATGPVLPTVSVSDAAVLEGNIANFRINFSTPTTERLNITYEIVHVTTSGGEVPVGTTTIIANAGLNFRGVNVQTAEDTVFEPNETYLFKVLSVKSAATGADAYSILDGEGLGTVTNDDEGTTPPPSSGIPGVTLSKENLAVTEGGATDTFTVKLDAAPTANVSVQVSTGNELMAQGPNGSSTLVFTPQNWSTPQTITVKAENDFVDDGAMTDYVYFMTSSTDARYNELMVDVMMPVAITDAAPEAAMPYVTVANLGPASVAEDGTVTFTFHRSDVSDGDLPILWKQTGTVNAADIESITWQDGYVGFKGSAQTTTATFKLKDDADIESAEELGIEVLQSPAYFYDDPFTAKAAVTDNDTVVTPPATPGVTMTQSGGSTVVTEGGSTDTFTVKLDSKPTANVFVQITAAGRDAQATVYDVMFTPDNWDTPQTVTVEAITDTLVEPAETETLSFFTYSDDESYNFLQPQDLAVTVNDAAPPALSEISVSTANVTEGGDLAYTFTRTNANAALDVAYTVGGTATAADFTAPSGTVQFAAGATTATVTVKTTNDTTDEPDETVILTVTPNAANYTVAQGTATASIIDNDEPVVVTPPPAGNQTITASTTATAFTGGAGIDTLVFPVIPAGGVQMLGGSTVVNSTISLGGTINGTVYNGKAISNIENLTFNDIQGPANRSLTVNGDAKDNTITVVRTTKKVVINAGDGADTINYTGTGNEAQGSVLSGGAGNDKITVGSAATIDDRFSGGASGDDTYDLGSNAGRQTVIFGADNGKDTVKGYTIGDATNGSDVLDFASAGINASTMKMTEANGNTVFTINGSQTVTVEGVTGMVFGTHWTAQGTYTPPVAEPLPVEEPAGITISEPGGTEVAEGGKTDTVTVKLDSRPTANVTIPLSTDPGITLDKQSVTFTPDNWSQVQTITVTAEDDTVYEPGTGEAWIYFGKAQSADPRYDGYEQPEWPYATAYILDNDEAGNTAPTAWDDTAFTDEDNLSFDLPPFAADSEQSTSELSYEILSQPEFGTVSLLADGQTFHFEGNKADFDHLNDGDILPLEFTYKANDGFLDSNVATFTINVQGVTDAPAPVTTATANPDLIL